MPSNWDFTGTLHYTDLFFSIYKKLIFAHVAQIGSFAGIFISDFDGFSFGIGIVYYNVSILFH